MPTASPAPSLIFEGLFRGLVRAFPERARQVDAVILFTVTGKPGAAYTLDLRRSGQPDLIAGHTGSPDLQILIDENFLGEFLVGDYSLSEAVKGARLGVTGEKRVYDAFADFLMLAPAGKNLTAATDRLNTPSAVGVGLRKKSKKKTR